ncbi:MAG TPA: PA domain-containing protein [Candidatus Acidoferrum sp.]|nr:PA domain-containing protein [Candidatus Acidoferrum sp.]
MKCKLSLLVFALLLSALAPTSRGAATIVIQNGNAAGVGFNDPTPVAPVGGNPGTTLGQQRLNAFQFAANIWGSTLNSVPTIVILSTFEPLTCTATSAVLGSAGPTEVFRDFTGAPFPGTWYNNAHASAIFGTNLDPATPGIRARFNSNLGQPGCLTGVPFYLGLDNNHGAAIDLVTVLLHEFAHGFGFLTVTNGTTGAFLAGFPSAADHFLFDNTTGKSWVQMTAAERAASALNTGHLVWIGANVTSSVPGVLALGAPQLNVSAPASVSGTYLVGTAAFGPPLNSLGVTGEVMPIVDSPGNIGLACNPLSAINALAVNGKIALLDRGVCGFTVKVKNAQNAGAIGALIVDNVAGSPPPGLGGSDPTITIPAVRITLADGNTLKAALTTRSRTHSGMFANIGANPFVHRGADAFNRVWMYAPNPFQGGSSVSHWDISAFPNLLMEPAINGDLTHSVVPPQDLTFTLLKDIGWNP